jgi:hypothetical protein
MFASRVGGQRSPGPACALFVKTILACLVFFISNTASGFPERVCFDDERPNLIWIAGEEISGEQMMGPFAYSEDSIDRCVLIEIPRLVALSKVMESMPNICRESRACAYDMDKDNVVGLDDVGSLIADAMSYLGTTCRQ